MALVLSPSQISLLHFTPQPKEFRKKYRGYLTQATIKYSPDGQKLLTVNDDGLGNQSLMLWHIDKAEPLITLEKIFGGCFTPDGQYFLVGSIKADDTSTLEIWHVMSLSLQHSFPIETVKGGDIAINPSGKHIMIKSDEPPFIQLLDLVTGSSLEKVSQNITHAISETVKVLDASKKQEPQFTIRSIQYNPDGTRILIVTNFFIATPSRTVKSSAPQGYYDEDGVFDYKETDFYYEEFDPPDEYSIVQEFDAFSGQLIRTLSDNHSNHCVYSPSGRYILDCSQGFIRIWDAPSDTIIRTLGGEEQSAVFNDNRYITSKSMYGHNADLFKIWDLQSGRLLGAFGTESYDFSPPSNNYACSPDKAYIAHIADGTLAIWAIAHQLNLAKAQGHFSSIEQCVFSMSKDQVMTVCSNNSIKIWNSKNFQTISLNRYFLEAAPLNSYGSKQNYLETNIVKCEFSKDGREILICQKNGRLQAWNISSIAPDKADIPTLVELKYDTKIANQEGITQAVYSPDEQRIVLVLSNGTISEWDLASKQLVYSYQSRGPLITDCIYSSDGQYILAASKDKTLKLWHSKQHTLLHTFIGHSDIVSVCAFSQTGDYLISGSNDKTIKLWNFRTGNCIKTLEGHQAAINYCGISFDGRYVISTSLDKTLKVWNVITGDCVSTYSVDEQLTSCDVSTTNYDIVAGDESGALHWLKFVPET